MAHSESQYGVSKRVLLHGADFGAEVQLFIDGVGQLTASLQRLLLLCCREIGVLGRAG